MQIPYDMAHSAVQSALEVAQHATTVAGEKVERLRKGAAEVFEDIYPNGTYTELNILDTQSRLDLMLKAQEHVRRCYGRRDVFFAVLKILEEAHEKARDKNVIDIRSVLGHARESIKNKGSYYNHKHYAEGASQAFDALENVVFCLDG